MRRRSHDIAGCLAVTLAVALLTAPIWALGRVWALQEVGGCDLFDLNAPLRAELLEARDSGRLPVWSPRLACGWPLLGEMQIGAFFPLNYVGSRAHPLRSVCFTICLVLLLAGLSAYALARTLGCSPPGAAVAGATWPLSGLMVANVVHPNMLAAVALAPLALAFAEQSCRRSRARRLVWLAPVMALSFYAGYPQMVYLAALAVGLWLLMRRAGLAHLGWLAAAVVLTALLTAPQLWPTLEMTRLSQRASGLTREAATLGSMEPAWLARWIWPWIQGDVGRLGTPFPADGIFIWTFAGPLPLLALAVAVARVRAQPALARGLAALGLSLLFAFGRHTPFYDALRILPGFSLFRFPVRMLFLSELALALFAGWLVTLAWRRRRWRRPAALAGVGHLAILLAVDLTSLPTVAASEFPPPASTADALRRHPGARYATLFGDEAWIEAYVRAGGWKNDVRPFLHVHALLRPNNGVLHDVPCVHAMGTLLLPAAHRLFRAVEFDRPKMDHPPTRVPEPVMRLFRESAARFVLSPRPLTNEDLREVHLTALPWDGFQVRVYELTSALPRARVEGATGTARVVAEGPAGLEIEVDAAAAATLTLADTAYPGWRAFVDGGEVAWRTTEAGYRALSVPAGRHVVRMTFAPTYAAPLAALAVVGLVGFLAVVARRGRA
jgi:hypothetical protein